MELNEGVKIIQENKLETPASIGQKALLGLWIVWGKLN